MSAFAFADHPVDDLIRKNLNLGGVFVRAAQTHRRGSGADVATANAHIAYNRAMQLVRALPDEQQEPWYAGLLSLQAAIHGISPTAV